MKNFVSFLIFFFVIVSVKAQSQYLISVKNKLGYGIPYASISWGKITGISANSIGFAKISNSFVIDTIYVSSVGYPIQTLRIKDLPTTADTILVILSEQTVSLPPLTVFAKEKINEVGITETQTSFISNRYRNVIAALEVCQPSELCKIKSVSVFIHKKSQLNVPFRIRIFNKNGSGLPENDLLTTNVICETYKKNEWNEIVLENYNVFIDKKEFFIAIEWLNISDLQDNNDLQVGLTNKDTQVRTLFKLANKPWKKLGISGSKFDNIMLKANLIN